MKKIEKVELVEKKIAVWVADDGTEFESEWECSHHEQECKGKLLENIERCTEADGYAAYDGGSIDYDDKFLWYKPKTEEEICLLNDAYSNDYFELDEGDIGKWVCVKEGYDYYELIRLDNAIKCFSELLGKLGYEITVTEKA